MFGRKKDKARNPCSVEEIFHNYYRNSKVDVADLEGALEVVCRFLRAEPDYVRPTDTLSSLAKQSIVSPRLENLCEEVDDLIKKHDLSVNMENLDTVHDMVVLMGEIRVKQS